MAESRVSGVVDGALSTDEVVSETADRVRASRALIDHIDVRLARSNQILSDNDTNDLRDG